MIKFFALDLKSESATPVAMETDGGTAEL